MMVGRARFELAVSWSQTRRFTELSHRPRRGLILVSDGMSYGAVATTASPMSPCGARAAALAAAATRQITSWLAVAEATAPAAGSACDRVAFEHPAAVMSKPATMMTRAVRVLAPTDRSIPHGIAIGQ